MDKSENIVYMRVLIAFDNGEEEAPSVTKIAQQLGVTKYVVSRAVSRFAEIGYINRENVRRPFLTGDGRRAVKNYKEKIEIARYVYLMTGREVSEDVVFKAAMSYDDEDPVYKSFKSSYELYKIISMFKGSGGFSGRDFSIKVGNARIRADFKMTKVGDIKNCQSIRDTISMAQNGFEKPCEIVVINSDGSLLLRPVEMKHLSMLDKTEKKGHAVNLCYFKDNRFKNADFDGECYYIPLSCVQFTCKDNGIRSEINGEILLQMMCSAGKIHMPVSVAMMNVTISNNALI